MYIYQCTTNMICIVSLSQSVKCVLVDLSGNLLCIQSPLPSDCLSGFCQEVAETHLSEVYC